MDSFQIIESENSFLFKNEISSSAAPRIRQYIDTIAMLYSFACCIDQIAEIISAAINTEPSSSIGSNSNILSSMIVGFILCANLVVFYGTNKCLRVFL